MQPDHILLSDRAEIEGLVYRLMRALDEQDDDAAAASFAPDGIWYRQGAVLDGPQAIAEALSKRDPGRRTVHIVSNLHIVSTGAGSWTASYYLTGLVGIDDDKLRLFAVLDCCDEIERKSESMAIVRKTAKKLGEVVP